jgi:hypothetical protein
VSNEVTGRDAQIIQQALSIAIPIMLRHSLSSSNTMDMIRILLAQDRMPVMLDGRIKEYLDTVIGDLRSGKTYELEKNKRDGIEKSHFEDEMSVFFEKIVPNYRS